MLNYLVSNDNITIYDSYKVSKKSDMLSFILFLRNTCKSEVFKRSNNSLIREWRSHNLLYNFHILRSRTKHVDLETNQKWYFRIGYAILSILYL